MQFRSANTLPRDLGLFTAPDGEVYLASTPSPEMKALRGTPTESVRNVDIRKKAVSYPLPAANGGVCEILVDVNARKSSKINLTLANNAGEKVVMLYDVAAHTLSFDRRESGIVDFSQDFPAVTAAPTFEDNGKISLRIFLDKSSVEVFGNDGRFAMTNLVFPENPYTSLSISSTGGNARIDNLKIYPIK